MTSQMIPLSDIKAREIDSLLSQLNTLGMVPQQIKAAKPRRTTRQPTNKQCIARIWKSTPTNAYPKGRPGYGSRCLREATLGEFCRQHGKTSSKTKPCPDKKCVGYGKLHQFVWEHCGRYDEPCPKFFNSSVWESCCLQVEKPMTKTPLKTVTLDFHYLP